jgi:hypothetical protein
MRTLFVCTLALFGCDSEGGGGQHDLSVKDAALNNDAHVGPGASCDTAIDLTNMTMPYSASTLDGAALTGANCVDDAGDNRELYFLYDAGATPVDLLVDVEVDAKMAWDPVVSARTMCSDQTSENFCTSTGGSQRLEVLGATGMVTIIVDGTATINGVAEGKFTIAVHKRTIVASGATCDANGVTNRCDDMLICTATKCVADSAAIECGNAPDLTAMLASGSAVVNGVILPFEPSYYQGSCQYDSGDYPERVYKFTVAVPSMLTASTDDKTNTDFDTYLYVVQDACSGTEVSCADDVDGNGGDYRTVLTTPLSAGTYYLFVDASSPFTYSPYNQEPRHFRLTVTLTAGTGDAGADM